MNRQSAQQTPTVAPSQQPSRQVHMDEIRDVCVAEIKGFKKGCARSMEKGIYPLRERMVLTLLDDYGEKSSGKKVALDFSKAKNENIAEEAIRAITKKYNDESQTVTYLNALVPAVLHFSSYASLHAIGSFAAYTDEVREEYKEYLENYQNEFYEGYSRKYITFLLSVPRMIQTWLKDEAREQ